MKYSDEISRELYAEAWDALWRDGRYPVHVVIDEDNNVSMTACPLPCHNVVFPNVTTGDFVAFSASMPDTRDDFVTMCMECFGCVERDS